MSEDKSPDPAKSKRQLRLEAQLKENLKRRKEQARARRKAEAPDDGAATPDGDED